MSSGDIFGRVCAPMFLRSCMQPILKGIVIAFLCLLPSVFIIGWNDPVSLLPIAIMTLILGALLGFGYGKLAK